MARYTVNKEQVASRTLDEGTVLIHYESGYYYSLNGTGTFLWTLLSDRPMTLDELAEGVARHYELERDDVIGDVRTHLEALSAENLLIVS